MLSTALNLWSLSMAIRAALTDDTHYLLIERTISGISIVYYFYREFLILLLDIKNKILFYSKNVFLVSYATYRMISEQFMLGVNNKLTLWCCISMHDWTLINYCHSVMYGSINKNSYRTGNNSR